MWSDATILENEAITFLKYWATPTKLHTYVTLVGVAHVLMALIFVGWDLYLTS